MNYYPSKMEPRGNLLRVIEPSEVYNGIIVASKSNEDTLYELIIDKEGKILYRAAWKIIDGKHERPPLYYNEIYNQYRTGYFIFYETEWTMKLDPVKVRERKLDILLKDTKSERDDKLDKIGI